MKSSQLARPASIPLAILAATAMLSCIVASACSSNSPTTASTLSDASADDSSFDSGTGGADSSTRADSAGGADSGSGIDSASSGDGGAISDSGVTCTAEGGCYSCPPTNTTQFENACVTGENCVHYDNAANLPFWNGQYPLPALPP